jgi:23S rRNA pseudouridine1911/1915/1917 synthase
VTGEYLEFDSPRPADQEALIEALRADTALHPIED